MKRKCIILFCMLVSSVGALAGEQIYSFDSPVKQERFEQLTQELRCLVCQNESIADSGAGLAKDLRAEVYHKIQAGYDDVAIKKYLVERYGQFILFQPAMNSLTYVLWGMPFVFLIIAALIWWKVFRGRDKN